MVVDLSSHAMASLASGPGLLFVASVGNLSGPIIVNSLIYLFIYWKFSFIYYLRCNQVESPSFDIQQLLPKTLESSKPKVTVYQL